MKHRVKRILAFVLLFSLILSAQIPSADAAGEIITDPTGYTKATDVVYKKVGKYIANWGARGEDCVFLSSYAEAYYVGNYSYEALEGYPGGTSQSNAPNSSLYSALKNMMASKHTHQTSYGETRYQYCYTDCLKNDTDHISTFYAGKTISSTWDSGATWNREHTWPKSKTAYKKVDNNSVNEATDIMMLRPTLSSNNSSRGNDAYGESSGYYDPGVSVRGDCARIALYVYVRWGNTSYMWGSGGVIENLDTLLRWMKEDPVDTWEMGRNDAVQAITGVRNVFVDYPEFAWMLFGEEIPSGLETPSGIAAKTEEPTEGRTEEPTEEPAEEPTEEPTEEVPTRCGHEVTEIRNAKAATCTEAGYTGDTCCKTCGEPLRAGKGIPATGHKNENGDLACDICSATLQCSHKETEIRDAKEATCTETGYTGDTYCKLCNEKLASGEVILPLEHKDDDKDAFCDECTLLVGCLHGQIEIKNIKHATCAEEGYTGDEYCKNCGELVESGAVIPVNDKHSYGHWTTIKEPTAKEEGSREHTCVTCGHKETEILPVVEGEVDEALAAAIVAGGAGIAVGGYALVRKRRKGKAE